MLQGQTATLEAEAAEPAVELGKLPLALRTQAGDGHRLRWLPVSPWRCSQQPLLLTLPCSGLRVLHRLLKEGHRGPHRCPGGSGSPLC